MPAARTAVCLTYPDCAQAIPAQAVMLDLDGTLVNTLGDFDLALNNMLAEQGWPRVEPAFIARTVGKGSPYLIRQTLLHLGLGKKYNEYDIKSNYISRFDNTIKKDSKEIYITNYINE